MSEALKVLDASINRELQLYLGTPVEDRTSERYELLVTGLARSAMHYAKALVEERVAAKRQTQQQIGIRR
jgi:hypothetical protein